MRVALAVEIEEFGECLCIPAAEHFREGRGKDPVDVVGRKPRHDVVECVAAPTRKGPIVRPSLEQYLVCVVMPVDEAGSYQPNPVGERARGPNG